MWSSTRWQNYFFPNISRHFMNFSVSSSRTNASTHARKYSDPKQPSRENIQRKKQTETKSCVELRVHIRWIWRLPRSPAADDGVLLLSRWSQLILLMVLILQSQQKKGTWLKRYNCTKIGHTTCRCRCRGRGHARCCVGVEKDSSWWW